MKSRFILCLVLVALRSMLYSQSFDSNECLEVIGIAMESEFPIDGVTVKLFQENEEMDMTEVTSVVYHEHAFAYKLLRDSFYSIEISKAGYVSRMISISTKLPSGNVSGLMYRFEYEVQMFKVKVGMDDYYLDFPIALIDYDAKRDVFISHGKYTSFIKSKISQSVKIEKKQ